MWTGSSAEQMPISAAASSSTGVLNEASVDLLLLASLEQFKDQATDRLLPFTLKNMKTQAQHKRRIPHEDTSQNVNLS